MYTTGVIYIAKNQWRYCCVNFIYMGLKKIAVI